AATPGPASLRPQQGPLTAPQLARAGDQRLVLARRDGLGDRVFGQGAVALCGECGEGAVGVDQPRDDRPGGTTATAQHHTDFTVRQPHRCTWREYPDLADQQAGQAFVDGLATL